MTVPDGVTVTVAARVVTVKGPRGTLTKDLRHLPLDMTVSADGKTLKIERWFTTGKQPASIRSACSHIDNMITGVTKVRAAAARHRAVSMRCQRFGATWRTLAACGQRRGAWRASTRPRQEGAWYQQLLSSHGMLWLSLCSGLPV